tara:strand:+ start:4362 stop:4754 length:393 start_codon:yes stop_codon:yes gene_type:complete
MKTSDFKKILKPLIKQTVKEVILEEGILSGIVQEVARGLQGNLVVEAKASNLSTADQQAKAEEYERNRQERIRRLNESAKSKLGADVFEGTKQIADGSPSSALAGVSPVDAGVDISNIEKLSKGRWKHLI